LVAIDFAPRVTAVLPNDGFTHVQGTPSDAKPLSITAYNLASNLTITAPQGYEVSATAGGSYSSTLILTPTNGEILTDAFLRITAANPMSTPTGTVRLTATGINQTVDLNSFRFVFTNVGTNNFTMPSHVTTVDLLVVGGGSLGVELAGEILTDCPETQVTLVHSGERLLPQMPARASAAALTAYDPPTKAELDSGLAALNDVSTAEVVTAILAATADGSLTVHDAFKDIIAYVRGAIAKSSDDYAYKNQAGATRFTNRKSASARTPV
jgi:hypothetical protein